MARSLKPLLKNALSILIALVFLYVAFRGTPFTDLWDSLRTANYWLVLLLLPINVLSHWLRAVRWAYFLKPVKADVKTRNLFSGVMVGYAVNNILPRVGELVRPYLLGNLENISRPAVLGTVVVERILDFATFYVLVCAMLFLYPHSLDPFIDNVEAVRPFLLLASVLALLFFLVLFFKAEQAARFAIRFTRFVPARIRPGVERIANSFVAGLDVSYMRQHAIAILLLSFAVWGCYALAMYIPFYALDPIAVKGLSFGEAVLLLVISSIAWVLPAPGAMGTYHSFISIALVRLYGIDSASALSFALITHEAGFLVVMALGGWFYWRDRRVLTDVSFSRS